MSAGRAGARRKDELLDIWDGIRLQPGRTALSFMAVGVGMTALTVLIAALGGLRERSRMLLAELGGQVFAISAAAADGASDNRLRRTQADLLAAAFPDCEVTTIRSEEIRVPGQGERVAVAVVATDERLAGIRNWKPVRGRFLDAYDVRYGQRNAVISRKLSELEGWEVGRTVRVADNPFTIVGIVDAEGSAMQSENVGGTVRPGEWTAFVPRTAAGVRAERGLAREEVDAILVRVPNSVDLETRVASARRVISGGRSSRTEGYAWITPDTILGGVRRMEAVIGWTVGSVAALCLILGGTTLMSLMVANVRDRVTEIGLRRALGARASDVARLFLLEGCLVTGAAALAGVVATHAVLWFGRSLLPVPLRLDWLTLLVPLTFAVALGGAFSYWPARLAACISPAESLRGE